MTSQSARSSFSVYARIAGVTFLLYIAAGIISMSMAEGSAVANVLALLMSFSALVLGVTMYALTRDQGPVLALIALGCRVLEAAQSGESAIYFAVGSTIFCWLLLRGKLIPIPLAWLGVIASALLVVVLPVQLAGLLGGPMAWADSITWVEWLPMLIFELAVSLWLLIKGVAAPSPEMHTAEAF